MCGKRKQESDLKAKKMQKKTDVRVTSQVQKQEPSSSSDGKKQNESLSNDCGEDDVDWSDCDEELSINASLFENSFNIYPIVKPDRFSVQETSNLSERDQQTESHGNEGDEDDVEWSDCDEELSINASLFENSFNVCSTSKPDRFALQEISNLSEKDQQ